MQKSPQSAGAPETTVTTWKAKLILICFGLILGLIALELGLRYLKPLIMPSAKGTEFESLDDVRRTLLGGNDSAGSNTATSETPQSMESGNLRAIVNPHHHDKIIFDLKPNLDVVFQRAQVKTNSCGMREPERTLVKPFGTYRIAILGDSFTFGWGVRQEETFAQRLEDNLNRISKGNPKFEVLNFGVPGYSTFQEVAHFKDFGLDFSPDEVLVFFVQNDFELPFYVRDIYRPGGILSSTEFLRLGAKAIDSKIEEQRLQMRGLDPNSALAELSDLTKSLGIRLSLTINPRKEWKEWRDRLTVLSERSDIRLINMRPDFMRLVEGRKIPTPDLTLSFDPHPSPLRHAMYGDLLTPYFMDVIQ